MSKRQVLVVLPNQGFWYRDYAGVKRVLEEANINVRVASSELKPAKPEAGGRRPCAIRASPAVLY